MTGTRPSASLALNGALLMLAGLLAGVAIPLAPYPRLMLSAHNAGFTVSGLLSHVLPALALLMAWVLLVLGTRGVFREDRKRSNGGVA